MAHTPHSVLSEVSTLIRSVVENDTAVITYETQATDVAGWDSLNHIELVIAVEKHFKVKFGFAELQGFRNVGEMCDSIVAKLR